MKLDHPLFGFTYKMSPRFLNGHLQWVAPISNRNSKEDVIWYEIAENTWNIGNVDCHTENGILKSFSNDIVIKSTTNDYHENPDFLRYRVKF